MKAKYVNTTYIIEQISSSYFKSNFVIEFLNSVFNFTIDRWGPYWNSSFNFFPTSILSNILDHFSMFQI